MLYWILEIIKIVMAYLMADFLVGLFHWVKDTYFTPHTPLIGHLFIWSSRLHHICPRYVTEFSDWDLVKSSGLWTLLWMGPYVYLVGFSLFNFTLFICISLNDVIHKYAHLLDSERPEIITKLQKIGLIQSHDEHHLHHIQPNTINYCPITPYVNYPLEKIDFWRRLEMLVLNVTGQKPREFEDKHIEDNSYPAGIKFIL
jgi:hypothetical protein